MIEYKGFQIYFVNNIDTISCRGIRKTSSSIINTGTYVKDTIGGDEEVMKDLEAIVKMEIDSLERGKQND
jgi:hypothetical protein